MQDARTHTHTAQTPQACRQQYLFDTNYPASSTYLSHSKTILKVWRLKIRQSLVKSHKVWMCKKLIIQLQLDGLLTDKYGKWSVFKCGKSEKTLKKKKKRHELLKKISLWHHVAWVKAQTCWEGAAGNPISKLTRSKVASKKDGDETRETRCAAGLGDISPVPGDLAVPLPGWRSRWASCACWRRSCTPAAAACCWRPPDTCCRRRRWWGSGLRGGAAGSWCSRHSADRRAETERRRVGASKNKGRKEISELFEIKK